MKQIDYRQGINLQGADALEQFESEMYQAYGNRRRRTHMHLHPRKHNTHTRKPRSYRQL